MPGSIKIDDGSGNYTILTNAGSLGSDKTITLPNTTGTVALTSDSFGKVLQVVSATSSTAQDTTSTSYVDITNLSVSITPSSSSNDILILYTDTTRTTRTSDVSSGTVFVQLLRDSTSIAEKQASIYNSAGGNGSNSIVQGEAISELDSPSTTSAITYKMQMKASSSTTISSQFGNSTASLIAMEIAG